MSKLKVTPFYMLLSVLFVTCLLLSNTAAVKLIQLGPLNLTAAVILFPITYIVNDLLAEVYGYERARLTIYLGFAMNLLMVVFYYVTIILPAPPYFELQEAYASILGNTPRLLVASMAAYMVGTTLNAKIMVTMRDAAKEGKGLFLRCITSTLAGELCDSLIFVTIGFYGVMPIEAMVGMIFTQAAFKTLYEVVIFPVTNTVINKVKQLEGLN